MIALFLLASEVVRTGAAAGGGLAVASGLYLAVRAANVRTETRRRRREEILAQAKHEHETFADEHRKKHRLKFTADQRRRSIQQRYEALCRAEGLRP